MCYARSNVQINSIVWYCNCIGIAMVLQNVKYTILWEFVHIELNLLQMYGKKLKSV